MLTEYTFDQFPLLIDKKQVCIHVYGSATLSYNEHGEWHVVELWIEDQHEKNKFHEVEHKSDLWNLITTAMEHNADEYGIQKAVNAALDEARPAGWRSRAHEHSTYWGTP